MKVTIKDTLTQERCELDLPFDGFYWADGNGSCDCNRAIAMGLPDLAGSGTCLGCKRFIIVACEDKSYTLQELNGGYPRELINNERQNHECN